MVFRDTARDGTTRLTGAKFLKDDADKLYLPKYQEYDSGWINIGDTGAPAFQNGAGNYAGIFTLARFRRIGDIVYMEGLVASIPASPGVIFNLPVGFRPSEDIIPQSFGNTETEGHGVRVLANGNVQVGTGVTGFTSLHCHFPAADAVGPWHVVGAAGEPAFGAGWSNFNAGWGTARFMKIGNYVYLQGLVQRTSGTNTTIFTLPAGFTNTNGNTHTPCPTASNMGGSDFGVNISAAVVSRAAGSNTGWVSLSGIRIFVGANDNKWKKFRGGADGWYGQQGPYGGGWPVPAIRRDGKVAFLEGLANFAATGAVVKLPYGYGPGGQIIVPIVNSSNRRFDITGPHDDTSMSVISIGATGVNGFTNTWVVADMFEGDARWSS